jgi:hypothetical protein
MIEAYQSFFFQQFVPPSNDLYDKMHTYASTAAKSIASTRIGGSLTSCDIMSFGGLNLTPSRTNSGVMNLTLPNEVIDFSSDIIRREVSEQLD